MMGLCSSIFVLGLILIVSFCSYGECVTSLSPIKVLVPLKVGFTQFVSWYGSPHNASFDGFCIQVFQQAVQRLSIPFAYEFVPFGDGNSTPFYDSMLSKLEKGEADAIVADLTITKDRIDKVDFTLPYLPTSLVMVVPFTIHGSGPTFWDFLHPFSLELWLSIAAAFVATGLVVFLLEDRNPEFSRSKPSRELVDAHITPYLSSSATRNVSSLPNESLSFNSVDSSTTTTTVAPVSDKRRLMNAYWFTSLSVFFAQQEAITSHAGRVVTVAWLLVVLIFTSSYTASLASLLSQQLSYPTIRGFASLQRSDTTIGYQQGSFVETFLRRQLGIQQSRLKPYASEEEFANALRLGSNNGGVGAILDESPYAQILFQSECDFTTVGNEIAYFGGFGFAFAKNSSMADEVSKGILSLMEDGVLQRIKDGWIGTGTNGCSNSNDTIATRLEWRSFAGLFVILGGVYGICIVWRLGIKQLHRLQRKRALSRSAHHERLNVSTSADDTQLDEA